MQLDKLDYQAEAIAAVIAAINPENVTLDENPCANPILHDTQGIDVKMETGTGKTYVYTRLMHELKQRFGFFKFIILVPSLPIKEGTKMSIQSDDWNKHFRQEFNNQSIALGVINAGDFNTKKGKRKQMPEPLRSFCDSTRAEANNIQALLINDAMLASTSMTSTYDSTLFGSISRPLDGLKATHPIVIIDEPHRFSKDNKAWENITKGLQPQLIVRFGATFPDITVGKGKFKETKKDYENLVYNLSSVRAFNEGLVKGVHIMYPALNDADAKKYKITSVEKGKSITIDRKAIKVGESLSLIDSKFGHLTLEYETGNATKLKLSNELAVENDLTLVPDIFGNDYQSLMLSQALDAHFEREKENFIRPNKGRIKTNSLFFIESIASFRGENRDGERKGWLREKFEELLRKKLEKEIATARGEYKQFLEYSLQHVSDCLAGYFAEDNQTTGDDKEKIQNEVDNILRNKEQSLIFKNKDGQWNVCRFFFSKWTLCEGWDNPNIFVITKLRSSGSENRKIQEVGRGLRLPFDENGKRISNEEFYLTYIIDYSEREFARKLVGEINADGGELQTGKITERILELLVKAQYAPTIAKAKGKLLLDDIIDDKDTIIDKDKFFALLPEQNGLKAGRVISEDLPERPRIKLNKANFEKLRSLWAQVTKRYLLHFEEVDEVDLKNILVEVLNQPDIFREATVEIVKEILVKEEYSVGKVFGGYQSVTSQLGEIPYGEFLKRLNKQTNLPIHLLHAGIVSARQGMDTPRSLFNIVTLHYISNAFAQKFIEVFAQKFTYQPLDFSANTSIMQADGEFKEYLPQGDVGNTEDKELEKIRPNKTTYLYDKYVYDSEIEHEVLRVSPPAQIVVYGKLPRRSIKLPTYTGGTTSPDFVYAIKGHNSDVIKLHFIVETKSDNPRLSDKIAVEAQQKAFAAIGGNIEWKMETDVAAFERDLKEMVGEG